MVMDTQIRTPVTRLVTGQMRSNSMSLNTLTATMMDMATTQPVISLILARLWPVDLPWTGMVALTRTATLHPMKTSMVQTAQCGP
jgi:hypothetical protein